MEKATTVNLELLEVRAEQALEKAETGWREFAETMREIKESGAHEEAGYRYFQPYYRERWEPRTGKSFSTVKRMIIGLGVLESIAEVDPAEVHLDYNTAEVLSVVKEPEERLRIVREQVESGESLTTNAGREQLRDRIRGYKGEPVVRDVLQPEDMADLPSREMPRSQKLYHRTSEIFAAIEGLDPADVAAHNTNPKLLQANIEWAERISAWYAEYADELKAMRSQPLRVVGGER